MHWLLPCRRREQQTIWFSTPLGARGHTRPHTCADLALVRQEDEGPLWVRKGLGDVGCFLDLCRRISLWPSSP
eukprot:6677076-Pyramimonas_sp.AAC.1